MNAKLLASLLAATSISTVILSAFLVFSQQVPPPSDRILFQASSLNSLLLGSYEGKTTVHDLLDHGDFGLGAMEYMDGELVCLDAACYRVSVDGVVHRLPAESKVAFAAVSFSKFDKTFGIDAPQNYTELQTYLDGGIMDKNTASGIVIHGFFSDITTRSVPKQDRLYVPLSEVVAHQTVFHLSNVSGTLVGFYVPDYMKEINVAKYHFHFITDDLESGGHVLDMHILNGTANVSTIDEVHISP